MFHHIANLVCRIKATLRIVFWRSDVEQLFQEFRDQISKAKAEKKSAKKPGNIDMKPEVTVFLF